MRVVVRVFRMHLGFVVVRFLCGRWSIDLHQIGVSAALGFGMYACAFLAAVVAVLLLRQEPVVQCGHASLCCLLCVKCFFHELCWLERVRMRLLCSKEMSFEILSLIIASSVGLFVLMFLSFESIVSSSEVVKPSLSSSKSLLLPSSVFTPSILRRLGTLFVLWSSFGFSCVLLLALVAVCTCVALATDTAS